MSKPLPERPNLEQLKHQAKDLLRQLKQGDPSARQRILELKSIPGFKDLGAASKTVFSLSLAQRVIARESGFGSWAKLKAHVEALAPDRDESIASLHAAFMADDAATVAALLARFPEIKAKIDAPVGPFDSPAVTRVASREMLDVLLDAGADINAKSGWWAGGFGLLHSASPELAAYAIQRGARVDIHAAARLGLFDQVRTFVEANPELVHARGGDGQTPLHFAATVEIAAYLLDHGADLNARDIDHESTPVQYMIRERQEIARYLVGRGCQTDILMAAALGDQALAERLLAADPACLRLRVSDECFPKLNPRAGGTIYQWTLGWHVSAPQVAKNFGHHELYRWLMERSPAKVGLINACWMGDKASVEALLRCEPDLADRLDESERRQLAHAARNNDLPAVRLFLRAGLPVSGRGQHGATALHWAAWHGNVEMVKALLPFRPPLEAKDSDYGGTPLRWANHGSENGWARANGDYPATLQALLAAGAEPVEKSAS